MMQIIYVCSLRKAESQINIYNYSVIQTKWGLDLEEEIRSKNRQEGEDLTLVSLRYFVFEMK